MAKYRHIPFGSAGTPFIADDGSVAGYLFIARVDTEGVLNPPVRLASQPPPEDGQIPRNTIDPKHHQTQGS